MNKLKYTCSGETQYATCINYEGKVNESSELLEKDCLDLDQTTSDLYSQIEKIIDDSQVTSLGATCMTYPLEEGKIKIKNVLKRYEEEICNLRQEVEDLKTTAICELSIVDCNLDFKGLTDSCGDQPKKLKEVLQLIINNITLD